MSDSVFLDSNFIKKPGIICVLLHLLKNAFGADELFAILNMLNNSSFFSMLSQKLIKNGFDKGIVEDALLWLLILNKQISENVEYKADNSCRIFSKFEMQTLDSKSVDFITWLESKGVLTPLAREIVINQLFLLRESIDDFSVKIVVMMVLIAKPAMDFEIKFIEDLIFEKSNKEVAH